jgi:hypothetical protein
MAEPIEITPATPPTPPPPAEPDETTLRRYVKEKYGIEDEPEAYKGKAARWQQLETEFPKYQQAVGVAKTVIEAYQRAGQTKPTGQADDDEAALRELARIDPYEAYRRLEAKRTAVAADERRQLIEEASQQGYARYRNDQEHERASSALREAWPEAYDTSSELHKVGMQIYHREMTDWERALPNAHYTATERAAGRLGLAPKARRSNVDKTIEVESQNVGRGARRPVADEGDEVKLTQRERDMAEAGGVDPKIFAKTLAAKRAGRNIVVS